MTIRHLYFAIEDLGMSASQRQTLRDAIVEFYTDNQVPTTKPAEILAPPRLSLDGTKAIFEAAFDDALLTVARFKQFLADTFSVDVSTIDNAGNTVHYGDVDTPDTQVQRFGYAGTDRIRVAFFGGVTSTWGESHDAVLAYLDANRAEWDAVA